MSLLLWVLGAVLVAVGVIGIVIPALPGTVLIFFGLLIAASAAAPRSARPSFRRGPAFGAALLSPVPCEAAARSLHPRWAFEPMSRDGVAFERMFGM